MTLITIANNLQPRLTYVSVTCFLKYQNRYLFLRRSPDKKVDANRLNGIGGKVEKGETYIQAAIRETAEETGYIVQEKDLTFSGFAHLQEGYQEDWLVAFFVIDVSTDQVPHSLETSDGRLCWVTAAEVPHMLETFFLSAILNEKEKIDTYNISLLTKNV
jgi:8-oxo-dGTP pyrophosphatase MutT (NUDIX family)